MAAMDAVAAAAGGGGGGGLGVGAGCFSAAALVGSASSFGSGSRQLISSACCVVLRND